MLKVGYGKCDITPKLGAYLQGHNKLRYAELVHDKLYLRTVAFEYEGDMAFMLCYDLCGMHTAVANRIREEVAAYVGCPAENVVLSCTHTHTGPNVANKTHDYDVDYENVLTCLSMHAAGLAKNDLVEAQMFIGSKELRGESFCRRYLMKDGSARTNPGIGNPDILRPMNDPDFQVQVLKIVREGARDLALVNFGCHADSIKNVDGKDAISADWPGVTCAAVDAALGVECVVFNGPCGDVAQRNSMDPKEKERSAGWTRTVRLGRGVASAVIAAYNADMTPIPEGPIKAEVKVLDIPLKRPTEEELARSRDILEHEADYVGGNMQKTTTLFEAKMLLAVAKTNGIANAVVTALHIGGFAAAGISGEPFCQIGKDIKAASTYDAQFVLYLTNGSAGYFPMKDAFNYDGYEARTCKFQPGVGELLVDTALTLLNNIQ